jgi:hypothetical protein
MSWVGFKSIASNLGKKTGSQNRHANDSEIIPLP